MFRLLLLLFATYSSCQSSEQPQQEVSLSQLSNSPSITITDSLNSENIYTNLDSAKIDTAHYQLRLHPSSKKYSQLKKEINKQQRTFLEAYSKYNNSKHQDSILAQAADYITEIIINQIIPYWYGTQWDFSGYTDKPNDGQVGCSYFVSTTLLHAGFNLNRYQLAQQGPLSEAKSLLLQDSVLQLEGLENMRTTLLNTHSDGLFFIGLEHSHVGYLLKRQGEVFFIQSSYGEAMSVIIEKALHSTVLGSYTSFYLIPITAQKELIRAWVLKKSITIVKGTE